MGNVIANLSSKVKEHYKDNEKFRKFVNYSAATLGSHLAFKGVGHLATMITGNPDFAVYGDLLATNTSAALAFVGTNQILPHGNKFRKLLQVGIGFYVGADMAHILSNYAGNNDVLQMGQDLVNTVNLEYIQYMFGNSYPRLSGGVLGATTTALFSKG